MTGTVPRIAPCIWFDDQAEAAAKLYETSLPDTRVVSTAHYPEGFDNPSKRPRGSVMTVDLELGGTPFTLLNGGPHVRPNPTISFFLHTTSAEETDQVVEALAADGGEFLMPLDAYPWSPRYAWVQDPFGVSWQVMFSDDGLERPLVVPALMFAGDVHGRAEEALRLYADVFPDGKVEALIPYAEGEGPTDTIKHGLASLSGQSLVAMDSHLEHDARFDWGVSLQVLCRDQAEVDHFWDALQAGGGEPEQCGWLRDRFGVSWQIVPLEFLELMRGDDVSVPGRDRAFQAMLEMTKLEVAKLMGSVEDR